MLRSLTNSDSASLTMVREISIAGTIGVHFGILLDERGHPRPRSGNWARTQSAQ